jgi:hypothetical protein
MRGTSNVRRSAGSPRGPPAPASIHALISATSFSLGRGSPFGGIEGFAAPVNWRKSRLSSARPALNTVPRGEPRRNDA